MADKKKSTTEEVKDISYNLKAIETKWQQKWEADKLYRSVIDETRPKHYALTMLPYPSGDLHIGHWYAMTPSDARARFMRMRGYNVLFPMGFDAFGLPAENAAIKEGVHPMKRTFENIERMRRQMKTMGAMFDWEREAISASPEYYKWTEWFFIQLPTTHGEQLLLPRYTQPDKDQLLLLSRLDLELPEQPKPQLLDRKPEMGKLQMHV